MKEPESWPMVSLGLVLELIAVTLVFATAFVWLGILSRAF